MVALIESAKNDLSKVIKLWQDEEKSIEKVEFYSEKKLAYFCMKAMEAMAYLHVNNVYFGDMKPENLLLFRDYRIKLGDLGVSMKIPEHLTMDSPIYLKGLTPKYSLASLEAKYLNDEPVTVRELFLNDYYSLMRTFEMIHDQVLAAGFAISPDCHFLRMLQDLKKYEEPLMPKVLKWQKLFSEDNAFLFGLCDELLEEDKIYAVTQVLRLSKFRNYIERFDKIRSEADPTKLEYKNDPKPTQAMEKKAIQNGELYHPYMDGVPDGTNLSLADLRTCITYYFMQFYKYDVTYEPLYKFLINNYTPLFNI